jgi:hypothetical protein
VDREGIPAQDTQVTWIILLLDHLATQITYKHIQLQGIQEGYDRQVTYNNICAGDSSDGSNPRLAKDQHHPQVIYRGVYNKQHA